MSTSLEPSTHAYTMVLGIAQDGGFPQAGCRRSCCARAVVNAAARRHVACLAIVDPARGKRWLIDATPDFAAQLRTLDARAPANAIPGIDAIFLTHAHIGHYTGLMHLGREAIAASRLPVFTMPRLGAMLTESAPWSQLVALEHIALRPLATARSVDLDGGLSVTPLAVPHRAELSETVGFIVAGSTRRVAFIPDIDAWELWDEPLESLLADVDVAYIDGTFFDDDELEGRDMITVPHPTVCSTLERLADQPPEIRARVRFIHLNHTNALLDPSSGAQRTVTDAGMGVAEEGEVTELG